MFRPVSQAKRLQGRSQHGQSDVRSTDFDRLRWHAIRGSVEGHLFQNGAADTAAAAVIHSVEAWLLCRHSIDHLLRRIEAVPDEHEGRVDPSSVTGADW